MMNKQGFRKNIERQPYARDGRESISGNLRAREDGEWKNGKKNSSQGVHLLFPRVREPCLFDFKSYEKVNCPIDFKGMTS